MVAPNVLVNANFEPGVDCVYIFNIYYDPDENMSGLFIVPDDELQREVYTGEFGLPPRTETLRILTAAAQSEAERLAYIENERELIAADHGVNPEMVRVTEINKAQAMQMMESLWRGFKSL